MASLLERARLFFDGKGPEEPQQSIVRTEPGPSSKVAAEIRDNLLGQSLDAMSEWKMALRRAGSDAERVDISNHYRDQLAVMNGAFDAVSAVDPTITTRLDIDRISRTVAEQSREVVREQSTNGFELGNRFTSVERPVEQFGGERRLGREEEFRIEQRTRGLHVDAVAAPDYESYGKAHESAAKAALQSLQYEGYPRDEQLKIDHMLDAARDRLSDRGVGPIETWEPAAQEVKTALAARREQSQEIPIERREIDIAAAPLKELHAYKEQLDERWKEVASAPNYAPHVDLIHRQVMISEAIGARERGVEVNQSDRAVILNTEQKAALEVANSAGFREAREAQAAAYAKEHGYPLATPETPKPVSQLSKGEIVTEVRELHSQFQQLSEEYQHSPSSQREHIREEMKPLVARENELRQEHMGRAAQEMSRDRVPDEIGYSR